MLNNNSDSWTKLESHRDQIKDLHMRDLFAKDENRFDRFHTRLGPVLFDYSKHRITEATLPLLFALAEECKLSEARDDLFSGLPVNSTENRAALHTALRGEGPEQDYVSGALGHMEQISSQIRGNKDITDILCLGIGGSLVGPQMVCKALDACADGPRIHFLSNLDGKSLEQKLRSLQPDNTAVIISSKTFTTLETMENAKVVKKWAHKDSLYAITGSPQKAEDFGIPNEHILLMKDWIGGRYSVWSVIGLPVCIAIGFENFQAFLEGARQADEHFLDAQAENNIPLLMGLLGIWYRNFFDFRSHAVLPYHDALSFFPQYVQQLDMESNGKASIRETGPVVFGGVGTPSQHAFFQHLHQSNDITPSDFVIAAKDSSPYHGHHTKLVSNALAQSQALMSGRHDSSSSHHHFEGNRPSSTFILDQLTPESLGILMALYEHKIFVQGVIWGINSFDQFGVELGKVLAEDIIQAFENDTEPDQADSSTRNLVRIVKDQM